MFMIYSFRLRGITYNGPTEASAVRTYEDLRNASGEGASTFPAMIPLYVREDYVGSKRTLVGKICYNGRIIRKGEQ